MFKINDNYLKLPGSYLFSTVGRKAREYKAAHPDKNVISLGIGDVTQPLAPAIIQAMHKAVDEMGEAATFRGYAPDLGYEFLRSAIANKAYKTRGVDIALDEIFVSDGAKSDCGNIGDIFPEDNRIAVCDPVYPVYVDTNAMAGRCGDYLKESERWSNVTYMPCVAENNFVPALPEEAADVYINNREEASVTADGQGAAVVRYTVPKGYMGNIPVYVRGRNSQSGLFSRKRLMWLRFPWSFLPSSVASFSAR